MGRADLIGNGRRHLVPAFQPIGTGRAHEGKRMLDKSARAASVPAGSAPANVKKTVTPLRTQHTRSAASPTQATRRSERHGRKPGK